MKSSDFLFRLIKSLSKGDRRNFKLYGRLQEGDKKYIQLFDAIDRQEDYDEQQLLEQFKDERFVKQFSVAKNYLYNYILKTLHIFHKDQHSELGTMMHQIDILMGKNLFDQAHKLVRKAKHVAERQECFQELIYLLDHERKILNRTERSKEFQVYIDGIRKAELEAMAQLENYLAYQHLMDETYILTKKGQSAKDSHDAEKLNSILGHPLMAGEQKALSTRAKLKMYDIRIDCAWYVHDTAKSLEYTGKVIDLYEGNREIRMEKNIRYIWALANYGVYAYSMGLKKEALAAFDKLRNIETYNSEEEIRVFEKYYHFKIALCIDTGDVETGCKVIQEFEQDLVRLDGCIMKAIELTMYFSCAYFYVTANMFDQALPWINRILNEPRTELRTDLQCMARILSLVVHYELGNYDLLEYMIKSAARFITNRNRLLGFERAALKHMRVLINQGPGETTQSALMAYAKELEEVLQDPFERKALNLFNAKIWIQAKLAGTTMADIFRAQALAEVKQ